MIILNLTYIFEEKLYFSMENDCIFKFMINYELILMCIFTRKVSFLIELSRPGLWASGDQAEAKIAE